MKTEQAYIRITALSIILLTVVYSEIFSQGTDTRMTYAKEEKLYIGLVMNPQMTNIKNKDFTSSSALVYKNGTSINLALEGGYFFSKIVGISIGAGMDTYSTELSMDSCSIKFQTTDSENETFEMRIKGKSILEQQKLSFLSIPVCLVLRSPVGGKLGYYVKAGISFDIPIVKTYDGSGIFTYDGYYAAYPVLLQDLPVYGFPSKLNTSASGDLEIKSFSQTLVASCGATYSLNDAFQLIMGVNINKSLGNISAYKAGSDYKLTSKAKELNSIMGGTSGAGFFGFGVNLGFRFYIR
jgi:hypothetical protein